jgi:hypothetical protein
MIAIPAMLLLYAGRRGEDRFIFMALVLYAMAKSVEYFDQAVYAVTTGIISGHSLKHLMAAAGCAIILFMLKRREHTTFEMKTVRRETMAGRW